ncbi:hypothetical protein ACFL3T_02530 [Patescibacteria group bacterium]
MAIIPGREALEASKLMVRIGANEWRLSLVSAPNAKQAIQAARRKCGKNVVTPEFLLKQDEGLFWSMKFHYTDEFRRFLAGDIGAL